jgi:putative inorganic carbon (HCO3(-)) transporter
MEAEHIESALKRKNQRESLRLAYIGLILFMVDYYVRPDWWIPGLVGFPLLKTISFLILLAIVFSSSAIQWRVPREIIFLGLLMVQLWLSAVFSPIWRGGPFKVMLEFYQVLPLIVFLYWTVRSMKRLRWILLVQAASVAAISIISIVNAHAPGGRLEGVLSGMYGNSNDFALLIDISVPICLAFALTTRRSLEKLMWTVAMLAMIYAVFLTASRAGAIALLVAGLVCLWQLGVKGRRFYLFLVVPIVAIVIWLYSGNALRQRFGQTAVDPANYNSRTEASESAEARKELLIKSLKVTAEYPLFGIGPGNFAVVSGNWHVSHNSYAQMSAEGGIPAFCLYIFMFWRAIANLREVGKYRKSGKSSRLFAMALQASLGAYLAGSFFATDIYQVFPYCLVAYTSSLLLIARGERSTSNLPSELHPTSDQAENTVGVESASYSVTSAGASPERHG